MRTALGLRTRALLAAAVVVSVTPYVQGDALVAKDGNGIIRVTPYTLDSTYQNTAWTTAQQDAFWTRNTAILNSWGSNTSYGSTYFENEKSSYPKAMLSYLWGIANNNASSISSAKAFLVDNARYDTGNVGGADNTNLVDLYPSFTLKGQMTKYFWFGKLSGQTLGTTNGYLYLKYPAGSTGENVGWDNKTYLDRMQDAMSKWTNDSWTQPIVSTTTGGWTVANNGVAFPDPLTRPNQYYSTPGQGWTEAGWNSWVDVRNTDNLKAMREAAVYLFAQESNNPGNMARYKANLQQVTTTLYRTGQSEWDSENYWCWSIGPNLSVLDYANDPALKRNAKANLDFDMCCRRPQIPPRRLRRPHQTRLRRRERRLGLRLLSYPLPVFRLRRFLDRSQPRLFQCRPRHALFLSSPPGRPRPRQQKLGLRPHRTGRNDQHQTLLRQLGRPQLPPGNIHP